MGSSAGASGKGRAPVIGKSDSHQDP